MALPPGVFLKEATQILRPFWPLALFATFVGALSGFMTAWLLAVINDALHSTRDATWSLVGSFLVLCLLSVSGMSVAGTLNSNVGQKIIAALRKDISARILKAPIASIEAYRMHRLIATLTNDVNTVSVFTLNFSGYAIAFFIALGCLFYLLLLSPTVFILAFLALAFGIFVNAFAMRNWIRDYEGIREAEDDLQKQYRAITEGAKELKMNRIRRGHVHNVLLSGAADRITFLKTHAMRLFWLADAGAMAIFFLLIGFLLVAQQWLGIDTHVISGAVIVLLYVKSPVQQIAGAVPVFDQARVSFQRIAELSAELSQHEPTLQIAVPPTAAPGARTVERIELRDVRYAFPETQGAKPFVLGPLNLTIRRGEMVFIVGENGSGKTSLIKLLLGLYEPQQGVVLLNGEPVTAESRDDYRQLFTIIFSDYFLFDDLVYGQSLPEDALPHLRRLGLAHKVIVKDGCFSTTDLSTGQRKRLALVHAYLEKRPIVVTDEWAADQDLLFRTAFYTNLLPELKRENKMLIVISHDDRYFNIADRVIRLHDGRIVADSEPAPGQTDKAPRSELNR